MHSDSKTTGLEDSMAIIGTNEVEDGVPFVDLETGLTCMVWAMQGHWNGYVQVPAGHIFYDKTYHECVKPNCKDKYDEPMLNPLNGRPFDHCGHTAETILEVHGGITFSGHLRGQPQDQWWLGFDTAHFGDMPGFGTYKDMNYVLQETLKLAKQLV